jgi:exodeoxyribonuclease VII, small subunit
MDETLSFEEAFERLETTIAALKDGKMALDQALQHYQDGMQLAHYCNQLLQKAELTVQQLSRSGDEEEFTASPLDM